MEAPQGNVEVKLFVDAGADAGTGGKERADELIRRLNREIREIDGVVSKTVAAGPLPKGAKAGFAAEIGAIALSIGPAVVQEAVKFLQSWISRPGNAGVKVKVQAKDGRVIEIEGGRASVDEVVKVLRAAAKA